MIVRLLVHGPLLRISRKGAKAQRRKAACPIFLCAFAPLREDSLFTQSHHRGQHLLLPMSVQSFSMADTFTQAERSRIMAAVKSRDTTPEMIVRRLVHRLGYRYRLHVRSLPGTPDLVFPRLRKIINVSGCFWHMHHCGRCRIPAARRAYWIGKLQRNAARDRKTRRALRRLGWRMLVVWECQTTRARRERLLGRIMAFLGKQPRGRHIAKSLARLIHI
jgi:DNA mismatch endonuclease (patch repair protein)